MKYCKFISFVFGIYGCCCATEQKDDVERAECIYELGDKQIIIEPGQITRISVDAIGNAANKQLQGGGGVCGAIFTAAGKSELQKACDKIGFCPTGSAVVTPAFGLKTVKWIIHAVAPSLGSAQEKERLLRNCVRSTLDKAEEKNCQSLAIPCFGSSIFLRSTKDWNIPIICDIIADEVLKHLKKPSKLKIVYLMCFPGATEFNETYDSYKDALHKKLSLH